MNSKDREARWQRWKGSREGLGGAEENQRGCSLPMTSRRQQQHPDDCVQTQQQQTTQHLITAKW